MTASQYKNVIEWSLYLNKSKDESPMIMARKILNNLGVALPQGNVKEILHILESNTYMGWRSCSLVEAEQYAEIGVPTIAINEEDIVIIKPSSKIPNFSADAILSKQESPVVKCFLEINENNSKKPMSCFSYCYGKTLEKYKK